MRDTIGVVVATYGSEEWKLRGIEATRSADAARPNQWLRLHDEDLSLSGVRNYACEMLHTDWVIFLDADDRLDRNYITAMRSALWANDCADNIYKPATRGFDGDRWDDEACMIPSCDLFQRNHIVIGAMVSTERFHEVGGFSDYPLLEDWDLWLRLHTTGSGVVEVPNAIYCVGASPNGRNQQKNHAKIVNEIRRRYRGAR